MVLACFHVAGTWQWSICWLTRKRHGRHMALTGKDEASDAHVST
jgi:hypothetical protein